MRQIFALLTGQLYGVGNVLRHKFHNLHFFGSFSDFYEWLLQLYLETTHPTNTLLKKNKAERFICLKRSLIFLTVLLFSSFGWKPLLQAYKICVLQKMLWNLSNKLPCSMSLNDTSFLTVVYNKKNYLPDWFL